MGCANSLLLMELHSHGMLAGKRIVLFEPELKIANDRTFCFWLTDTQLQALGLDHLVGYRWSAVQINDLEPQYLDNKNYYYLRADVLYAHVKTLIKQLDVRWHKEAIQAYPAQLATWVFDSRPPQFEQPKKNEVQINQSFYGWVVKTEQAVFDPNVFTMMDFTIPQNGQTQFLYVLPFAADQALIEPTRFGKELLSEQDAQRIIDSFLYAKNTDYTIIEREHGCIPMCTAAIKAEDLPTNWIRTGAGSGQLKPSTGYSFVRSYHDAQHIAASFRHQSQVLKRRVSPNRFAFYDRLLLQIIDKKPQLGQQIFTKLFKRNHATQVLNFLDEKTTLAQELKLMSTLPILPFVLAAIKDCYFQIGSRFKQVNLGIYAVLLLLFCQAMNWVWGSNLILLMGFFAVGLPHGALDHLVNRHHRQLWKFIAIYLTIGSSMLFIWYISAPFALLLFIAYTAWHFGQADFEHWGQKEGLLSFSWGLLMLAFILLGHSAETAAILSQMGIVWSPEWSFEYPNTGIIGLVALWLYLSFKRSARFYLQIVETLLVLFLALRLPLLAAFGAYFIFQHSIHGWQHLKCSLGSNNIKMWRQALPFTVGSAALFAIYVLASKQPNWGQFFIFLSALSLPHVWYMHKSYRQL